jgi:hypothetical protein
LVRTASFENFTIYTPPNGHSSHVGECRVRQEMVVSDLVRRTQRYGTSFKVWRVTANQDQDAGQQDAASEPRGDELIWDSAERKDSRTSFSTPLHLLPGDGFRFQCDYENPTDHELRYGVSAADETCTLEAIFWPARPDTETQAGVSEDCLLSNVDSDGVARPRL